MGLILDGTTESDYVHLWDFGNDSGAGFDCFGSIKNTGLNSMTVRLTATTIFGATDTTTTAVLGGAVWDFKNVVEGLLGAGVPMGYVSVEVKSTLAISPTTYSARIPSP